MGEKIIKLVISLIPTILIIACVGAAFATHDWDMQATILGENPLEALESFMPSEMNATEEPLEIINFTFSEEENEVVLEAVLHSPLNVPVTIKEMQAEFELEGSTVTIHLPEEVAIPAQGSASITLEGSLPPLQDQLTYPSAENLTPRSMTMTVDVGGIEVKFENLGLGGAG